MGGDEEHARNLAGNQWRSLVWRRINVKSENEWGERRLDRQGIQTDGLYHLTASQGMSSRKSRPDSLHREDAILQWCRNSELTSTQCFPQCTAKSSGQPVVTNPGIYPIVHCAHAEEKRRVETSVACYESWNPNEDGIRGPPVW